MDPEVEQEQEKAKRIETERMKAVRDLEKSEPDKANLAYLDPKRTKVKGWSKDPDVLAADIERMGNRALIVVISGVILSFIGFVGGMVTESNHLGAGGVIISALPNLGGVLLMGVGILIAIITIGVEIYLKLKKGRKLDSSFWTSVIAIIAVGLYFVVRWAMMRIW